MYQKIVFWKVTSQRLVCGRVQERHQSFWKETSWGVFPLVVPTIAWSLELQKSKPILSLYNDSNVQGVSSFAEDFCQATPWHQQPSSIWHCQSVLFGDPKWLSLVWKVVPQVILEPVRKDPQKYWRNKVLGTLGVFCSHSSEISRIVKESSLSKSHIREGQINRSSSGSVMHHTRSLMPAFQLPTNIHAHGSSGKFPWFMKGPRIPGPSLDCVTGGNSLFSTQFEDPRNLKTLIWGFGLIFFKVQVKIHQSFHRETNHCTTLRRNEQKT